MIGKLSRKLKQGVCLPQELTFQKITGLDTTPKTSERIFGYAVKILLVVGTLFYLPVPGALVSNEFSAVEFGYMTQELFFRYAVIFLYGLSLFIQPKRVMNIRSLGVFLIYFIVNGIFINFEVSTRRALLNCFMAFIYFDLIVRYIDIKNLKSYTAWLYWLLVANLGLALLQQAGMDPIYTRVNNISVPLGESTVGFMKLKATLGTLTALITPLLFSLSGWLLLVTIPLIYWSQSSSSVLAILASVGFILYFRVNKKLYFSILLLMLAAGFSYIFLFDMPGGQFNERFKVWFFSMSHVLRNSPFLGYSLGSFGGFNLITNQATTAEKLHWIWLHNEFLQMIFEGGIIGLVIVLGYLKGRWKEFIKYSSIKEVQILFGSLISLVVISLFNFPFHIEKTAGLAVFLMALYQAKIADLEEYHFEHESL